VQGHFGQIEGSGRVLRQTCQHLIEVHDGIIKDEALMERSTAEFDERRFRRAAGVNPLLVQISGGPMELTVQNVYGLLLRSRLMSLGEAQAMYARWQEEAKDAATNLSKFASWMVSHQYVTDYQASLLARGHADGFFLNEYKILERLGKGRMAGVYKAKHQLGQIVAIKVLPPSRARDATLLGRFQREARLALLLDHPNVVRSFQMGVASGLHYLVMEYLEGETFEELSNRRGKMPPAEAVRLVYEALLGLQHIHEKGLVHRDLKPSNLMVVRQANSGPATVKILDIGLGRVLFDEAGFDGKEEALTGVGVLLGTPDYMAPEQANDPRTTDIRADIYSLGCVLYHLLAGQPPFPDTNIISQMIRHATEQARPLKDHNAAVPDGLQQIVNWMMAKDPGGRYPTPDRAAQALKVFLVADGELRGPAAPDAKLTSYLSWLQLESKKPQAPPDPSPAEVVPVEEVQPIEVVPVPAYPVDERGSAAAKPKASSSERKGPSKKASRSSRDKKAAAKEEPMPMRLPVVASPLSDVDVELVLPGNARPVPSPWGLSRRDFVLFGIGAAAGSLATFLGCLVALTSKKAKEPPPE
jgi:serine/threonine protein kinase